jgi:hypothetical protein
MLLSLWLNNYVPMLLTRLPWSILDLHAFFLLLPAAPKQFFSFKIEAKFPPTLSPFSSLFALSVKGQSLVRLPVPIAVPAPSVLQLGSWYAILALLEQYLRQLAQLHALDVVQEDSLS